MLDTRDFKILEKLKGLEALLLKCSTIAEKMHVEELLKIISSLPSLILLEINMSHPSSFLVRSTWSLDVGLLGSLPFLSTLSLRLCACKEVQGLDHLQGLTILKLECPRVQKCIGISQLSRLTTLVLRGCEVLCASPFLDLREVYVDRCCFGEDQTYYLRIYQEIGHHNNHKVHIMIYSHVDFK